LPWQSVSLPPERPGDSQKICSHNSELQIGRLVLAFVRAAP
jgi:hypothetical protein